ncbi:flp pilus-assembly TadE/G-like family protein [Mycobacterium simiae]|uniref:Flp pilus-assembly TadE/G-like family protein n=1 Tax=Mycobacterium simiae TaxID=1784 RepID=A0A5B1BKC5_MYCSI|nr:flp pilus-assembly TadE/G-like family protein [Mycobacterium simiae]
MWFWCCAWPQSPRYQCNCDAPTRPARPLDWLRVVTNVRLARSLAGLHRLRLRFTCAGTASTGSLRSSLAQNYCPPWAFPPRRSRLRSRDDAGSATVLAVSMVAVLLFVTAAGAYLGAVAVARHRAQAAADLAALAAAARLPHGPAAACASATAVARAMRIGGVQCGVQGLDVVVTVEVPVGFPGTARAAARAGPVEGARD